jgi:hypothetical protein
MTLDEMVRLVEALDPEEGRQTAERPLVAQLWAAGCLLRVVHLMTDERSRVAVLMRCRWAVGACTREEWDAARAAAWDAAWDAAEDAPWGAPWAAAWDAAFGAAFGAARAEQTALLLALSPELRPLMALRESRSRTRQANALRKLVKSDDPDHWRQALELAACYSSPDEPTPPASARPASAGATRCGTAAAGCPTGPSG